MIFIVEDDENIREMESYALKNSGYETAGFAEGGALMEALRDTGLAEHIRIGSQAVILSRSFCDVQKVREYQKIEQLFLQEVQKLRDAERHMRQNSDEFFRKNQSDVQEIVRQTVESSK